MYYKEDSRELIIKDVCIHIKSQAVRDRQRCLNVGENINRMDQILELMPSWSIKSSAKNGDLGNQCKKSKI